MTKSDLEKPGVNLLKLDKYYETDNPKLEQYAHHLGVLCVDDHSLSRLDKSHWLKDLIKHIDEEEISVEAHGTQKERTFDGMYGLNYTPCDYYHLSGPLGTVHIEDVCFGLSEDELLVPGKAQDGDDLLLVADYSEEYGGYDDNAADTDTIRFDALLTTLNASREEGLLNMIKRSDLHSAGMSNKQLIVTFDVNGMPCEVKEQERSDAA